VLRNEEVGGSFNLLHDSCLSYRMLSEFSKLRFNTHMLVLETYCFVQS
jgi:hypothetical protein